MTREEALYWLDTIPTIGEQVDALEMAIQALSQVTKVRKLILQAERSGVHLDYGAYRFMNALEKIVGEKQIGEFEQEPCDDAISREAVLSLFDKSTFASWDLTLLERKIKALPPVTQKSGEWIPFSERLPKPFEHCLITTTDGEVIYHYDDGQYSKYKAWMPLPKPYEPQEGSDKE